MYNATNSAPHRPSAYRVDALRTLSLRSTAQLNDLFVTTLRFAARRNAPRLVSIQLNDLFINLIAPHRSAPLRTVLQHGSTPLDATQGFVCYNASPRGSASHSAPRLPAAHRASIQLNDLFISFRVSTRRYSARLGTSQRRAPQRYSTICLSIYYYVAPLRSAFHRGFVQRYSTICLLLRVASKRSAPQLYTPFGSAPLRNSTQRFVCQFIITTRRSALLRHAPRRGSTYRSATQRFVCQFIIAPRHGSRQRTAAQLALPRRAATQRNELKLK
jgi:hypothetical protein